MAPTHTLLLYEEHNTEARLPMSDEPQSFDWETELAALLNDLVSVQDELFRVLDEKRELMMQRDVDRLAEQEPREQQLLQRLGVCRQRRAELLERASYEGLPSESIDQLAAAIGSPGDGLRGHVHNARDRMKLLRHHSLTNWVLAQSTVMHLSQLLEIIATGGRLQPTYEKKESTHPRGSLVDRAA